MRGLAKILVSLIANALGLVAAAYYVSGFHLATDSLPQLALVALIFMALNMFLKPILTLLFGPLILLTLGIGLFFINAAMLKLLDLLSKNITIDTTWALLYATLIIGIINLIFHLAYRKEDE
jgi:putative membrane protein